MNVKTFTLAGIAAPLFFASVSDAAITGLVARLFDPTTADALASPANASGTWAANGYPVATLDTWRVYAVSATPDQVLSVGSTELTVNIISENNAFHNATGAFGNNGLLEPIDFTVIPGLMGYAAQWDSFLTIAGNSATSLAPELATFLGATAMGMGGLLTSGSFVDTGWFITPTIGATNTFFDAALNTNLCWIAQLTVAEGLGIAIEDLEVASFGGKSELLSVSTIPAPGAIALLGLAGLAARRRRS